MNFNVTLIDPPQYKYAYFLTDTCRLLAAGLRELGHTCSLTVNNFDGNSMNVIVGTHLLSEADARQIVESGVQYIAFHTELVHLDHNRRPASSFLGDRFESVMGELLRRAHRVWDGVDSNIPLLAHMGVDPARIRLFWPGYSEALVDVRHRPDAEKDIDALFFGSISAYRRELLNQLGQSMRVATMLDGPWAFRNDMIARAKLNLVVSTAPEYTYIPSIRTGYLLNNRCAVVAEAAQPEPRFCNMVDMVPREGFVEHCQELISSGTTSRLADASFGQYQRQPFREILQGLLD